MAIVDAGPLYAITDEDDQDHEDSLAVLGRRDLQLVIPTLVVAEVTYLVGTRLGPTAEARFLKGLADVDVEGPAAHDWVRIGELVERYADFPLGGTDASVIALAERLGTDLIVTLDRRHFGAVRARHCRTFQLLP
ncbi:MAG: PIN domain-containing protein [Armatimonadetes bacterium]|nr:PIN domain-containing protein [Armatimonadota bacterium]